MTLDILLASTAPMPGPIWASGQSSSDPEIRSLVVSRHRIAMARNRVASLCCGPGRYNVIRCDPLIRRPFAACQLPTRHGEENDATRRVQADMMLLVKLAAQCSALPGSV